MSERNHVIVMDMGYQQSFEDLDYDAQELNKETKIPVRFEHGGFYYTVDMIEHIEIKEKE